MKGNGGVDYKAANGDVIKAVKWADYWYCTIDRVSGGSNPGAVVAGKCTAFKSGDVVHKTVLTLTLSGANDLDLADGGAGTGVKIYDFPAGFIKILGATMDASIAYVDTATTGTFEVAVRVCNSG